MCVEVAAGRSVVFVPVSAARLFLPLVEPVLFTDQIAKYAEVNMSKIIRGQQRGKANIWFRGRKSVNMCVSGWFPLVSAFLSVASASLI